MPLQNFEFPGVTLKQVFTESSTGTVSTLGAACVGSMYRLHRHDEASEAAKIDQSTTAYSPSTGLANVSIPGRSTVAGETLDTTASTHHLAVVNGVYAYPVDSATGEITVASGLNKIQFEFAVMDGNGFTAAAGFGSRGAKIGDPVVLTTTGESAKTVSTYIVAILASETEGTTKGRYDTIAVADLGTITASETPTVKFGIYADAVYEESSSTFTLNTTTEKLTVQGGLTTDLSAYFDKSAGSVTGTLQGGDLYFEYRERLMSYVGQLGVVDSVSTAETLLGAPVLENPLSLAVYFALQAAGGNAVYFTAVRTEDSSGYTEALDFLEKYTAIYSVTPCTNDADIIQACAGSVTTASDDEHSKVRRSLWYGIDTDAEITLYSGAATATVEAGSVPSSVTFTAASPFVTNPVQTGDYLYDVTSKTKYTITSTNYVNMAYVTPAITTASTDHVFKYMRALPTNAQIIKDVVAKRCTQSLRCQCVWADDALFNGDVVPNFCLAAAAAGMRSYEECWRPLSNLTYSFFSLKETHGFTRSQLKEVGANGIWIIGNNNDGTATNLKALTTAVADNVNTDNESIVSNADEIALALCHVGENLVGNSNISPTLLTLLSDQISVMLDSRTSNATSAAVGNQLISFEIVSLYQSETNTDEVYADIEIEPPKPFNQFHMTMRII